MKLKTINQRSTKKKIRKTDQNIRIRGYHDRRREQDETKQQRMQRVEEGAYLRFITLYRNIERGIRDFSNLV